MAWRGQMTDMALSDDEKLDLQLPPAVKDAPEYPWGLMITLSHREMEKLGLEDDCDIGDTIDLRAFAEVVSITKDDRGMGPECNVGLQIKQLSVENEDDD